MKKTLQLLALSSLLSLPAMATVFMSYENSLYNDDTTVQIGDYSEDFTQKEITIGIGGGDIDSYSYNIYYIKKSLENTPGDYSSNGVGINIRPYYSLSKNLHWYLDSGLEYIITDLDINYYQQFLIQFRTGIGISYLLADILEFTLGYKYTYIIESTNDNDTIENYSSEEIQTISITNPTNNIYFGINLWFGNAHKESKILKKIKPIEIDNRPKEIKEEVF